MTDLAIEARGLIRKFGTNRAVDGVDLAVPQGEIYGFLGPNGAGKSTMVRVLCTLLAPTAGSARVAGHDVVTESGEVRIRIGLALQEAALDDKQSGREILDLQARLYGLEPATRNERVERAIELADIGDAIDDWVRTYSGGMKRRLDVAASLIHDPEVLFLDEPTTGLDPVSRVRVWEEVRRLNEAHGVTVFLTTQYLEEADALAHRVGIIDQGRIVQEGKPADLKRTVGADVIVVELLDELERAARIVRALPRVDEVTVGSRGLTISTANGAALVAQVAVALSENGVATESLTVRTPSLDDVFLRATGHRLANEESQ
ncbi:MAG: ATP-binding cassette domain-containing protein [Actinomycetota bacterium]|nr:daunorubicin ABC transporter ATP-binding protein [Acidimicrobiaceae bacterium]MCS5673865.1 ATP-binding cassette domain-containing protein [Acidimicrobiales bacterium]MED5542409.1 ATP-binding cassette domain-containing protein [Actinomycetota bacterium]MEE2806611.1 ATP-binding cassette domain-containing protein [Actinomycetota bacterium]|tara:strand:- start:2046 stop:2999 length:954 start_codon:yes stop_codon:yes gene_type:complete